MEASENSQLSQKGSGVPSPRCDTPPFVGMRSGEGIARGAPRHPTALQRERPAAQSPGHHFRSSAGRDLRSASGGQSSSHDRGRLRRQMDAKKQQQPDIASAGTLWLVLKTPSSSHSPNAEVPQQQLVASSRAGGNAHPRRQDRFYFDAGPL